VDVVQVRVVFKLPSEFRYPHPLAYVEYFTGGRVISDTYGMWVVRRAMTNNRRKAGVIRLDTIRSSCHLFPIFGPTADASWSSDNILEVCPQFYVNPYLSTYAFNVLSIPYNFPADPPQASTQGHR
jgi:hypothetical protein